MKRNFIAIPIVISLLTTACVIEPIKPWHRDVLARENMAIDADEMIGLMDEQVYYSKEASSGGKGIGGGGCGCN